MEAILRMSSYQTIPSYYIMIKGFVQIYCNRTCTYTTKKKEHIFRMRQPRWIESYMVLYNKLMPYQSVP